MTEARRKELEAERDEAELSGDPARIAMIMRKIDREQLECQAHQGERLKRVEKDVSEIKEMVYEIKDEISVTKAKAQGVKILWDLLKLLASAGGGACILKLLGA